jgi:hypothetical protein
MSNVRSTLMVLMITASMILVMAWFFGEDYLYGTNARLYGSRNDNVQTGWYIQFAGIRCIESNPPAHYIKTMNMLGEMADVDESFSLFGKPDRVRISVKGKPDESITIYGSLDVCNEELATNQYIPERFK